MLRAIGRGQGSGDRVQGARGSGVIKAIFLSLFSACLLILSFPKYNLEFLAWIALVPLFWALRSVRPARAFLLAYLTGVIFWLGSIYWLMHVTPAGMILLSLYLALFFGVFGWLIRRSLARGWSVFDCLFPAAAWVLLEYFRSYALTGFPWALLGYSQYLNTRIIQVADITGVWGVSFLIVWGNAVIYSLLCDFKSPAAVIRRVLLLVFVLGLAVYYGHIRQQPGVVAGRSAAVRVAVVQGNIPQERKWDPDSKYSIIEQYLLLSAQALRDKPDLIVWPEAALPVIIDEEPEFLERVKDFARSHNICLMIGAVTRRKGNFYNCALYIDERGSLAQEYRKIHLVPFGEYIPLRKYLPFLETVVPIGDFTAGREYTVFQVRAGQGAAAGSGPLSALICFEDIFPELARKSVLNSAKGLVVITNDAWFKDTAAAYQHVQASVFRAVENKVPVIRAANTGISCVVDPSGRIIAAVRAPEGKMTFVPGILIQEVRLGCSALTLYSRLGDWLVAVCLLLTGYGIIASMLKTQDAGRRVIDTMK